MFDLATAGIAIFTRWGTAFARQSISRDPLSGVVDGSNRVFHTNYFPVQTSGSLKVYTSGSQVGGEADYDTGRITLTAAPSVQPQADYTFTPYTALQTLNFLLMGFDELELRWNRGFKLVDGSGNPADENSSQILVADLNGVDPPCGATVFSASRTQIALLMLCTEYRYYLSGSGHASLVDFAARETLRGMSVDKSKRPDHLLAMVEHLDRRLAKALQEAEDEYYPSGEHYGGEVYDPVTADYVYNFEWQETAKSLNNIGLLGYQYSVRPFYP